MARKRPPNSTPRKPSPPSARRWPGLGHAPERIGGIRPLTERLAAGARWDAVFNICEGLKGVAREAQVPALLEAYDIPYVFSDPLTLALTSRQGA